MPPERGAWSGWGVRSPPTINHTNQQPHVHPRWALFIQQCIHQAVLGRGCRLESGAGRPSSRGSLGSGAPPGLPGNLRGRRVREAAEAGRLQEAQSGGKASPRADWLLPRVKKVRASSGSNNVRSLCKGDDVVADARLQLLWPGLRAEGSVSHGYVRDGCREGRKGGRGE